MPFRSRSNITMSLSALLAGTVLVAMPALGQQVGTAAAVNPQSHGTPPSGETQVLNIGARIVHKERIQTTSSGSLQVLFADKTTLNVGPNSNLVIDKFVYDPAAGTGEMAVSLTKGALRFVGGQLSHQGAATVNTPTATIGIRGGIATIAYGKGGTRVINHFGSQIVNNRCGSVAIRRPDFAVTLMDANICRSEELERASQAEINYYLALLTSKPGQTGGARVIPSEKQVDQFGIGQSYGPDTPPIQPQTMNIESQVFDIIVQAQHATARHQLPPVQPNPPPPPKQPPPPKPPPPKPPPPPPCGRC
jgi:FecR protein